MKTKSLKIQLMMQNQINKEVVFNEAINVLDNFINKAVKGFVSSLPSQVFEGDVYIIKDGEHEGKIYYFLGGGWEQIDPTENMVFFVLHEQAFFYFCNNKWQKIRG